MFSLTWCGQTPAKKVTLSKFEEYNSGEATGDDLIDDHRWETGCLDDDDDGGGSYGEAAVDNHENGDGDEDEYHCKFMPVSSKLSLLAKMPSW